VAEAQTFLAQSADRDDEKRAFHQGEARAALVRAAAFGASLSPPADLPPEVLAAYERARARRVDDPPSVAVVGPGARVGARFNGRPLPGGAFDAVPGTTLVQAADGAEITAASRVRLAEGRSLVWLAPSGDAPLEVDLPGALAALDVPEGPRGDAEALLAGAARLLGRDVVYVVDEGREVSVYLPTSEPGQLERRGPIGVRRAAVGRWRAAIGAGPAIGWTNLGPGPLDGLGGVHAGAALYGRVAANDWLALAATVDPWAVASPIDEAHGGGTLFRATIPVTLGVRFGVHGRRLAPEVGVDVGMHAFGRFGEGEETESRASFLARAAAGLSGAVGPGVAARAQVWFGAGLGYLDAGGSVGVEGRL
jgi:hypothetical protein